MPPTTVTLEQFTRRIGAALNGAPGLSGVWVTAETSDLRRSGHCYLELVQKHPSSGEPVAKLRATVWRNVMAGIDSKFTQATGQVLAAGMKVMVKVTASYHPAYGLSANITDIDPSYTLGDLMRLRMEILQRLKADGTLELNRQLQWPQVPLRIAVVSAPGAAGYGDFVHQLLSNPRCLAFRVELFAATMQGATAPASIIAALERIAAREDEWDGVVVIRGGGATSDLAAFENYDLASNIAQFPLPVIVGIGHERDVTVLDYVANMRVKTPTAVAAWLIGRGEEALDRLARLGGGIYRHASQLLGGSREQLARLESLLPQLPGQALASARSRLDRLALALGQSAATALRPQVSRLDVLAERLAAAATGAVDRGRTRIDRMQALVEVLSPQATLARGYSITRVDGHAVTSAEGLRPGARVHTTLASGSFTSTVTGD